jgi:UDP-N-acetylmuramyl pentapeptide phosphotransferase/UDP-N-acetylglucosamine-1-phosphate transferase
MHMSEALLRTAAISALSTLVLVGIVRRLALRHGVLDHPTQRSSHTVVTPRGGGLGLVLAVLGVSAWQAAHPPQWTLLLLLVAAAAIALVGWLDDRRGLSVRARLVVHVMAGAAVGATAVASSTTAALAVMLFAGWTFWTVSSINLVNFMDGINGLVASQIVVFALSLAWFPDQSSVAAIVEMSVAGACLGFLPWNFPHARIFLGDVGSGALGFLVPALALLAMQQQGIDVVRAHLPLLPLFGDATWTILRRWRNGERLTAPHRTHLYQRLANDGLGHTPVTLLYTIAAVCGAVAAHMSGDARVSPWTLSYAAMTLIAGFILHRRASGGRRVAM